MTYRSRMKRNDALARLTPVAAEQEGLITSRQARLVGIAPIMLVRLADTGLLHRLLHGVYTVAVGRATPGPEEEILAAWLAVDGAVLPWARSSVPKAVVSHASAARILQLSTIIPTLPELTTERRLRPREGLVAHTARFTAMDWTWMPLATTRLPVTSPARTILDLWIADQEVDYLEVALRQAFSEPSEATRDLCAAAERRRPQRPTKLISEIHGLVSGAWS